MAVPYALMPMTQRKSPAFGHLFLGIINWMAIVLAVLVVAAVVLRDVVIKEVAMRAGSAVLGAELKIGGFDWGFFTQKIVVKDLTITHPPGFENDNFIDIPEIVVEYDLGTLLKGQLRMPLVSIDLKEMMVIKNKEGKLNVDGIKAIDNEKKETFQMPAFVIDELKLNVGRVIYKDQYKKKIPQVLVYDINIRNRTFRNINNVPKLITIVMVQALKPTAVKNASVYAAATIMGIGFLPGAVIGIMVAQDGTVGELAVGAGRAFNEAEAFILEKGRLTKADKAKGTIEGNVQGVDIKIKVEKVSWSKSRMTVSGRKYMLPKKEFAAGILYQIAQRF
jgi:hypothetical protein